MRPHFITPCYVRVEDADKRKEICEQLERIGYRVTITAIISNRPSIVVFENEVYGEQLDDLSAFAEYNTYCNCGTNTELFLALASMRSDTNEGQWFNTIGSECRVESWHYCQSDQMYDNCLGGEYRKASPAELIEHFKK